MIVSRSHRFIFVHIPKTAGSSVMAALLPFADGQDLVVGAGTKHEPVQSLLARVDAPELAEYFSFAFVRNPWRRLFSLYAYMKGRPAQFPEAGRVPDLNAFIRAVRGREPWTLNRHSLKPQTSFLLKGGKPLLDHVGRQETLERDFSDIMARIGLPQPELPYKNRARHRELPAFDAESDAFVREWFADDVRLLGYMGPDDAGAPMETLGALTRSSA